MPDDVEVKDDMDVLDEALPDELLEEKEEKEETEEEEVEENKEDKEDKEESEDKEDKEEKEEDKEEEKERPTQYDRPTITAIKKEFPEFFNKFPTLQNAFFREQEFTRLFPTVDDAKQALEDNNALSVLRDAALSGDASPVIEALSQSEATSIPKFAKTLLKTLHKDHNDVYVEVVSPLFENALRGAFNYAKSKGDEDLEKAAQAFSNYIFGTPEVAEGKRTFVKEEKPDVIDKKREEFNKERYQTSYADVESRISTALTKMISTGLDPDKVLTEYVGKKLSADVLDAVGKALAADVSHMAAMKSYWHRAQRNGFDSDSISKIVNAYLARAKQVMPSIRAKLKKAAIGDTKVAAENRNRSIGEKINADRRPSSGAPPKNGKASVTSREIDYAKTSDLDLLEDRITTRKQ